MRDEGWVLERMQRVRAEHPAPRRRDRVSTRWERAVDPEGVMRPEERRRQADRAMRRYMRRLQKLRHET